MNRFIIFLVGSLFLSACSKDNVTYIEGNTPPPDGTIESVTKETYVNKLYISLLGRQATEQEYTDGLAILEQNNLSSANRSELVDEVLSNPEYFHNEYRILRAELINGTDTADISLFKEIFELQQSQQQVSNPWLDTAILNLERMQAIIPGLENSTLTMADVQKRCIYNHFYDELNMGTENFVVSAFQAFLFRYPTDAELEEATNMVDGTTGLLFYTVGDSKIEFMNIFFSSNEYYEGQVRNAYLRFLFREPTAEEASLSAGSFQVNNNYKAMQKAILISDEYVGLD